MSTRLDNSQGLREGAQFEAMLVVDDQPKSSVIHIDTEMLAAPATGSYAAPAWSTRPAGVSADDWVRLQGSLFPERISISLCDCDLDLLDVVFLPSDGFDGGDVPPSWGVRSASGLLPYGGALMLGGLALGLAATWMEVQRKAKAERLAQTFVNTSENRWD